MMNILYMVSIEALPKTLYSSSGKSSTRFEEVFLGNGPWGPGI